MAEPKNASEKQERKSPPLWVFSLYFAEGFPYSLVRQISTVFFKDFGASLQAIGLTSLYGLPWVLKFTWAPLADAFATKRRWLLAAEASLAGAALAMAFGAMAPKALAVGSVLFFLTAILSATHDIAIDGYYLEALNKREQARFVGWQAMSYRFALIAGGGGIVWFSGVTSWTAAFLLSAAIIGGIFLFHFFVLPRVEENKAPLRKLFLKLARPKNVLFLLGAAAAVFLGRAAWLSSPIQRSIEPFRPLLKKVGLPGFIATGLLVVLLLFLANLRRLKRRLYASDSFYARAFVDYLDQRKIGVILAFLVFYRTGESFLLSMVYPMLKDIGINRADYGLLYGTFGILASITGGILGGILIGRYGMRRMAWPLVLAQNIPNLLYALLAFKYRGLLANPGSGKALLSTVGFFIVLESFGAGLGTSFFMVFIMRTCKKSYKAAHMAIATSVMNVSSTFAGVASGFLAAWLGFPFFFAFTFIATIPAMVMLPFLPSSLFQTAEFAT